MGNIEKAEERSCTRLERRQSCHAPRQHDKEEALTITSLLNTIGGKTRRIADPASLLRLVKFALSGITGFVAFELVLVAGLSVYGNAHILGVDVAAWLVGTSVAFFADEYWTFNGDTVAYSTNRNALLYRLGLFQLANSLTNAIVIFCQLLLLFLFGVPAFAGTALGGAITLPLSYRLSESVVWKTIMPRR
jgi:putative flippase GtrA